MDMSVAMLCPALSRTVDSPYSPITTTPSSQSLQVRMLNTPAPASSCSASASAANAHDSAYRHCIARQHGAGLPCMHPAAAAKSCLRSSEIAAHSMCDAD